MRPVNQREEAEGVVTTEVLVGLIGFGTAVVLATACMSRSRHIVHRHEIHEPAEDEDAELETDSDDALPCEEGTGGPADREREGNKYAIAALRAVELCRGAGMTPPEAWEQATIELFGVGTPAQKKGCPKGAFLGLCQAGYIAGVPRGEYGRGVKNKGYAVAAAELLARKPALAADWGELWRRTLGGAAKQHNSQMHVVIALWKKGVLSVPEAART
jgi:hypothetical protein